MPDRNRITRRTLLRRAGIGAGLLLGTGILLDRVLDDPGESPTRYLPGFNDDFLIYSQSDFAEATMTRVRDTGGALMRLGIDWGQVQAGGPRNFDWTPYERLYALALKYELELLPTVFGCPEWAGPVVTAGRWPGRDPELPADAFRTCDPRFDPAFGAFADATLRHFDTFSKLQDRTAVVRTVEILNEPNVWTFGDVPAARVRELTEAAAEAVAASQSAGVFSRPMRVMSGGLGPVTALEPGNRLGHPPRVSWQRYLTELVSGGPIDFDVGIHSYESSKPPVGTLTSPEDNPADRFARGREYAEWQAARILDRVDQALSIVPGDIWLTETGASSASLWPTDIFSPAYRAEFGQSIQAEALVGIAKGLRSKPRCRSMVVHRLYSNDEAEPPPTVFNSPHYQSGIYESIDGQPKLAADALRGAWG